MNIEQVKEVTEDLVEAFEVLMPQLTAYTTPPDKADLEKIVDSPSSTLFVAYDADYGNKIIGTATLVTFRTITGVHAWIEDVVVDKSARRKGLGKALTMTAIDRAKYLGAKTVNLTSRSTRVAANSLYQRLGFKLRETNLYRYSFLD
jgi:ribosomal protein S18 acetylase RimI-like enzyme